MRKNNILQRLLTLFRSGAFKWMVVVLWLLLFAGAPLTPLHAKPVSVVVAYYIILWILLVAVLVAVSIAETDADEGDR